jgi:hypothetical protein
MAHTRVYTVTAVRAERRAADGPAVRAEGVLGHSLHYAWRSLPERHARPLLALMITPGAPCISTCA